MRDRSGGALLAVAAWMGVCLALGACSGWSEGGTTDDARRELRSWVRSATPDLARTWHDTSDRDLPDAALTAVDDDASYSVRRLESGAVEARWYVRAGGLAREETGATEAAGGACFAVAGQAGSWPTMRQLDCPEELRDGEGVSIRDEPTILDEPRRLHD